MAQQSQDDDAVYSYDEIDEGDDEEVAAGEIKTGRWTPAEHAAFLRGMALHGREWKKVARTIQSRSSAQIRSHAQKHFAKSSRDDECLVMHDGPVPHHLGQALAETLAALMERRRALLRQENDCTSSGNLYESQSSDVVDSSRIHDKGAGDGSESDEMSDQELEAIRALKYLRSADKSSHAGTVVGADTLSAAADEHCLQPSTSASSLSSHSSSRPASPSLVVGGRQKRRHIHGPEGNQERSSTP